ncbi:hypothetical protein O1611_g1519 [Lasiodiplodia mahajangana]|uniref:Uncharacterized protein n=1 Tax=Lasiodiplodia mahajangana TaxID=1108764 RepID=A0ACC2JXC4_9PEZI|nr:hypothetical protein O1611_g1519 [Lasiodiplodia mahajangana]
METTDIGLASYGPYIGVVVMQSLLTERIGFLVNQWEISEEEFLDLLLNVFVYRIWYCMVMVLAKTAILLEWIHIFIPGREKTWFFWTARTMIILNITAYTLAIILTAVSCIPTWKIWQPWVGGHCFDRRTTDVLTAWVNLFIDLAIFALPQPVIWKLHMPRGRKIGVSIIFSIGLLVVACATGRIHANMILEYHGNTTYGVTMNALWAFGETTGVVIVFSTPAIAKAFSRKTFLGRFLLTFQSWTRLKDSGTGESGDSNRSHIWPPTIGGSGGRQPRKPTETELALAETQKGDDNEPEVDHHLMMSSIDNTKAGIVKTTNVERMEESASSTSIGQILESQHPWMNDARLWP